jgi:hypothetical protein
MCKARAVLYFYLYYTIIADYSFNIATATGKRARGLLLPQKFQSFFRVVSY